MREPRATRGASSLTGRRSSGATCPSRACPTACRKPLVQISDLHVGTEVDDDYLVACLEGVRQLEPDILVVTGDVLSFRGSRGEAQFEQLRRLLCHLPRGRLATLAILGNHDYGRNWSDARVARRVASELDRSGARVLRNECALVRGLDIVGIDDLWARQADPVGALRLRTGKAALVLCHNPDALDERPWGGYRGWILAGHTHGGQCKPPFLVAADPSDPQSPLRRRRSAAERRPACSTSTAVSGTWSGSASTCVPRSPPSR